MAKKKKKKQTHQEPVLQGTVIRSVGSSMRVKSADGNQFDCVVRGKFRIKNLNTTNPVAVGDEVRFTPPEDEEGGVGVIREILPRKNYILRKAIANARKVHILAANIDQAILLFTIDHPATSTGFANRFLVTAEAYHIPARVVINKIDLLQSEAQHARLQEVTEIYDNIGYEVIHISALDPAYKPAVEELLAHQRSFIGGHSGSGKSTLINLVDPDLSIKTAEVSGYSSKGRHTTTYSEMHPLAVGGYIIDSPGIKELGIIDFDKYDLSHYFPEMKSRLSQCKFNDCIHTREPGCAVLAALESGEIHASRYDSYLRMLDEIASTQKF